MLKIMKYPIIIIIIIIINIALSLFLVFKMSWNLHSLGEEMQQS